MTSRAVLCGCGAMAKGWLRALQSASRLRDEVEIVGLVDLDPAVAEALAAAFGLGDARIGTDLASMIEATKANMVFDVVVPTARFSVVSTALNLSCDVLSEKPLAASMEEANALLKLAEDAGRVHAVVQNRRFISGIRRLRRAVEEGLIGDLSGIHCDFFLGPHFGGFREAMDNVLLLDMAIHTFDAARFVSGKQPLSVYCVETNPSGSWYAHGASANAVFRLSGDAVFTYRGSWCAEGRRTSWESAWRLVGSKGMITWDICRAPAGALQISPGMVKTRSRRRWRVTSPACCAVTGTSPFPRLLTRIKPMGMRACSWSSSTRSRQGAGRKPRAATISKAFPWCSARSKAPAPAFPSAFHPKDIETVSNPAKSIRIGTMVSASSGKAAERIGQIGDMGFESFEPFFWQTTNGQDLADLGKRCVEAIGDRDITISTLGMFGNPLEETDMDVQTLQGWKDCIDNAHHFGATCVAGFTGRIRNRPLTESLPRYREIWSELAKRAADKGVKIAFENCAMDGNWQTGDWNIAHNPDAWELIFNETPDDHIGLEWEPCHQMVYLIDPIPQIRKWAHKFFHVHGKDATIRWDVIREHGVFGKHPFVFMRTPGFGDTNWTDVISELRLAGWSGSIDIEGWHDPVYRDALEMTGQVHGLNYLKNCRGGDFVTDPV